MADSANALTLELLRFIASRPRTYAEAMEAWRSSCPRHTIWEDALEDGLIDCHDGRLALTAEGRARLA